MRKVIVIVGIGAVLACLGLALNAISSGTSADKTRFSVPASEIHLGRVSSGIMQFEVPVRNRGQSDLLITSVKADCGCLHTESGSPWHIAPGNIRKFRFTLDVADTMRGMLTKRIVFTTNDDNRNAGVLVSFIVRPQMRLVSLPSRIEYGRLANESDAVAYVTLVPPLPEELRIDRIISSSTDIAIGVDGSAPNDGPRPYAKVLRVTLRKGGFAGIVREKIDVHTSQGDMTIAVSGYTPAEVTPAPASILWGVLRADETKSAIITLKTTSGRAFKIRSVTGTDNAISTRGNYDTLSTEQVIEVHRAAKTAIRPGPNDGQIVVDTDVGKVDIPYHFFVRAEE